ncbi:hypothetical protein HDU87_002512 [Geranomyces variabilis]|uniref:DNA2/NAM7 helicase-like C-terminal domain-containing protein n=1 Tax=Geranomyces variabilis TaxID=109894 RepID=A0AAD5TU75_9FUNG|nr:hypothetical protein HDU87_002512 [Geranomyces variabilis]
MPWGDAPLPFMVTAKATRRNELHIGVIDSIQGGERDYMIYSYVRGENSGGAIGFTTSANRQYMAATRMVRGGCWVLNAEVFVKFAIVGPIIAAAKRSIDSNGERRVLEWQPVHHATPFGTFPPEETPAPQRATAKYERFVKLKGHILLHDPKQLLGIPEERGGQTLPTACSPPVISRAGDFLALSNIKTRLAREDANGDLRFSLECPQERLAKPTH